MSSLLEDFEAATLGYAVRKHRATLLRALADAERAARVQASGFPPRTREHIVNVRQAARYSRVRQQLENLIR